jgi:hypothetical protein
MATPGATGSLALRRLPRMLTKAGGGPPPPSIMPEFAALN